MKKFRKKPVVIEAHQLCEEDFTDDHPNPDHIPGVLYNPITCEVSIETMEGTMTATIGDWIIRGIKGELYPCKPDIFEATYEQVAPGEA